MTATELVNIIKSPTSKVLIFGTLIIAGALIAIPFLSRDDNPDSIKQETELKQEEKAPLEIGTGIPRFKVNKGSENTEENFPLDDDGPPPVINTGVSQSAQSSQGKTAAGSKNRNSPESAQKNSGNRNERNDRQPKERDIPTLFGRSAAPEDKPKTGNMNARIFVLNAGQNGTAESSTNEPFLSERYAPFGRLLDCKLVNTLESNVDGTPLIAIVIEDLWWINAQGERKLIIPAGTEVHGRMGSCVRNRMMCEGNFILVWQITSEQVGLELQLQGRILEKSNQAGNKNKATITDMAAGIPGRVMNNNNLNEMLQYTMAFAQGLSAGFQENTTYDNGSTIISNSDGSTKNALATAFESLSNVALENITDKISRESYYIRVAAGTEFYLYIEQVTNVEKAAIADTALNNLEQLKLAQGRPNNQPDPVVQASQLHDALGTAIPKSMLKELKGIR